MYSYTDNIDKSIRFILSHFRGQEFIFPRSIMTSKTGGQVFVDNEKEMMQYFEDAQYIDCRINGYPFYRKDNSFKPLYPSFIFIDLDLSICNTCKYPIRKLDYILKQTLKKINEETGGHPTVLWTGGGYHIYQSIDLSFHKDNYKFTLESIDKFQEFTPIIRNDLTTEFIRFVSKYLTEGKGDPKHNPSIYSCLIRIPQTINSKNNEEVRIIQEWNGKEANAIPLLHPFWDHLIQMKIEHDETRQNNWGKVSHTVGGNIKWIEKLLQTPISDHRNFCLWRILIPYLKNIKGLSEQEVIAILTEWLDKCNNVNRVRWRYPQRIKEQLRYDKGFPPISFENLKKENPNLHDMLNM